GRAPPPPLRPRRPDVPKELERVVLRGLDRDRDRRWPSLEDLADALRALQPERQQPARPRALVMAFLVDLALMLTVGIVFGISLEVAGLPGADPGLGIGWLDYVV